MHAPHYQPNPRTTDFGYGFFRAEQLEENAGIYVSYKSDGGMQTRPELLATFLDRYYPAVKTVKLEPADGFTGRRDAYGGEYHLARAYFTTFEKLLVLFQPVSVAVKTNETPAINLMHVF